MTLRLAFLAPLLLAAGCATRPAAVPAPVAQALAPPAVPVTVVRERFVTEAAPEAELDSLVRAVRIAHDRGIIGTPLAVPCDTSSWFVARRERLRTCNHLLANALMPPRNAAVPGVSRMT